MREVFATPGKVLVDVDNYVGEVIITAGDVTTTDVHLTPRSDVATELVRDAKVECEDAGDRHVVKVKVPSRRGIKSLRHNVVSVRLIVPIGTDIDVATGSANVELNGLLGRVDVKAGSGNITADDTAGDMMAKTASGTISVGQIGGDARLFTTSGDVRTVGVLGHTTVATTSGAVEIGASGKGVDARSTSGDVRLGDVLGDSSVVGVSGNIRVLSFGAGRLKARVTSGNIAIGIAPGVNLTVDAETLSGTVHSDIFLGETPLSTPGRSDVEVAARSVSGNVTIERAISSLVA